MTRADIANELDRLAKGWHNYGGDWRHVVSEAAAELRACDDKAHEYDVAMMYLDELGVRRSGYPDDPRGLVRDPEQRGAVLLTLKGRVKALAGKRLP